MFYDEHGHGRDRGYGHNHDRYDHSPLHHYDQGCDARVGPRQSLQLPTWNLHYDYRHGCEAREHHHDCDRIDDHGHDACDHACAATFYALVS